MSFKKYLATALLSLTALSSTLANTHLVVAASPVPHAEILEQVKPILKKQGIDLEVKVFTDYVLPNLATQEGKVDANFFQHLPYLEAFNKERKTEIVSVGAVHIEPFAIYSSKHKNLKNIKKGATVAIPNDPSNRGRAFILLANNNLVTLKDKNDLLSTQRSITKNPNGLKFREVEAPTLPRLLNSVDYALINANYALKAGLNPKVDGLAYELSSPYANIVATTKAKANSPEIKALVAALQSKVVYDFIQSKYQGAVVPAFKVK